MARREKKGLSRRDRMNAKDVKDGVKALRKGLDDEGGGKRNTRMGKRRKSKTGRKDCG